MIISIAPDYAQFVVILFWVVVIEGFAKIIAGLLHVKKDARTHNGGIEIIAGIIWLLVVAWVMF